MKELTKETFAQEVLNSPIPVLVDFFATWCGPCRMLAPTIEEIAEDYAQKAKVVKCDIDLLPEITLQYNIMSVPTLMLFKNGEVVNKAVGVCDYEEIAQMLDEA